MSIVRGQGDHCVYHVAPIVDEPSDRGPIATVRQGDGQVFGGEPVLLGFLRARNFGFITRLLGGVEELTK
jgi:hypothetical protein